MKKRKMKHPLITHACFILFYLISGLTLNADIILIDHFNGKKTEDYCSIKGLRQDGKQLTTSNNKGYIGKGIAKNSEALKLDSKSQYVFDKAMSMRSGGVAFWMNSKDGYTRENYKKHGYPMIFNGVFQNGGSIKIYLYYNARYDEWILNCHITGTNKKLSAVNYRIAGSVSKRFTKKLANKKKWKSEEWHHVALTWSVGEVALYLDGNLMNKCKTELALNKLVSFSLGKTGGSRILLDELVLFDEPDDVKSILQTAKANKKFTIAGYNKQENANNSKQQPGYFVPFITSPPVMDGEVLRDPAWAKMPKSFVLGSNDFNHSPVFPPTVWGIARDEKYLYVSAVCFEPNMNDLHASKHGKDVWGDDAIELFFVPDNELLQFVANAGTGLLDAKGRNGSDWNCPDWSTATKKYENYWSIEFKMPLNVVAKGVKDNGYLKFNFARDFKAGNHSVMKYATWSYLMGSSFFKKTRYNRIILGEKDTKGNYATWKNANASFATKFKKDLLDRFLNLKKAFILADVMKKDAAFNKLSIRFNKITEKVKATKALDLSDYKSINVLIDCWMDVKEMEDFAKSIVGKLQEKLITKYTCKSLPNLEAKGISSDSKYYYINIDKVKYAINKSNGIISGAWNSTGEKVIDLVYDSYILESRHEDANEHFEFDDKLSSVDVKKHTGKTILSMKFTNKNIPGKILKEYTFYSNNPTLLSKKVGISDVKQKEVLMTIISNTCFSSSYRANSIYNRYVANGTNLTLYPANDIKDDLKIAFTTGWPTTAGWAQWLLINPKKSNLFSQYLWKVNDKIAFPPIAPVETYLTKNGWKLPYFTLFLNSQGKTVSSETCFDFHSGDRVSYYKNCYFGRKEIMDFYNKYPVPPVVKGLRFGISAVNFHQRWRHKRNPHLLPHEKKAWDEFMKYSRSDEGGVNCNMHWSIHHPDYAVGPNKDVTAGILEANDAKYFKIPSKFIKSCITDTHKYTKNISKVSLYTYHAEVFSPLASADKTWYTHLKNGKRINSSWCEDLFIANTTAVAESGKFLKDAKMLYKYLGMDSLYIDGYPALPLAIDWNTLRVTPPNYIVELSLAFEKIAREFNGFNFYNSGGLLIPGQDVAFFEGADQRNIKYEWQKASDAFLLSLISRRRNVKVIPLVWHADILKSGNVFSNKKYINNLILYGWTTSAPLMGNKVRKEYYGNDWLAMQRPALKVSEVGIDLSNIKLVDFDMQPCWWKDWNTDVESYSYNAGSSSVITFINHSKSEKGIKFSLNIDKAGIAKDKPVDIWLLKPISANDFLIPFKALQKSWYIRDLFSKVRIEKYKISNKKLNFTLPGVPPDTACVAVITQTPALVYSADKVTTDISLPEQVGVKINCVKQSSNSLVLKVDADKNAHIAIPNFDGNSEVIINKTKLSASRTGVTLFSNKHVLVVPVEKGSSNISVRKSTDQSNNNYSKINVKSLPTTINAGSIVPVSISYDFSNTPQNERKFISIYLYRDGICRYYNSVPVTNNTGNIKISLDTYAIPGEIKKILKEKRKYKYLVDIAVSTEYNVFNAPVFRKRCGEITITD